MTVQGCTMTEMCVATFGQYVIIVKKHCANAVMTTIMNS